MSINVNWADSYSPAQATRGQFLPLETASLTALGLPAASQGKYAVLTYAINPTQVTLSGVTLSVSAVNIEEPITISVGNTTQLSAITISTPTVQVINFSPIVNTIEVYNNDSTNIAYLLWGTATLPALTSNGLPLVGGAYYSIDRKTTQLTLGTLATGVNVRVFGHYEV